MFNSFSAMDISASGLAAERVRMEVTANNIANANTTQTESGDPFRKQRVVFAAAMHQANGRQMQPGGVKVVGLESDQSAFQEIYDPEHPHADPETGILRLPNVKIPNEMVDLITASRSYEANLRAISLFKDMVEQTLNLLQGNR